jgi:hypothetical protein
MTISQATPSMTLLLNGTANNVVIDVNDTIDLNASIANPSTGTLNLYVDGSLVGTGAGSFSSNFTSNTTGSFEVIAEFAGNQNFTAQNLSRFIFVGGANAKLNISPVNGATIDSPFNLTFTTLNTTSCRWSLADQAHSAMTNDFTLVGLDHSAEVLVPAVGSQNVYVACTNETAGDNLDLTYTIDNSYVNSTVTTTTTSSTLYNNSIVTNSTVSNSTLHDSTADQCIILDSTLFGITCFNQTIDPSDVRYSDVTGSTITDSHVYYSNATNSIITNTSIDNSSVDKCTLIGTDVDGSTMNDCTVTGGSVQDSTMNGGSSTSSTVTGSTVTDSTLTDSTITDSTLTNITSLNSTVTNTTLSDVTITDAIITDGVITNGTINGTVLYNATASGPANVSDIVNVAPTATFSASPTTIIRGNSVSFAWTGSDVNVGGLLNDSLTFLYDFADGSNSTLNATSHTFSTAGSFVVNLTVTDSFGKSASTTTTITVNNPPSSGGGGGGGSSSGGGGSSARTYSAILSNESQSFEFRRRDRIQFTFEGERHTVTHNGLVNGKLSLTIESEPQTSTFVAGQTRTYHLNNDSAKDLEVTVNEIGRFSSSNSNISLRLLPQPEESAAEPEVNDTLDINDTLDLDGTILDNNVSLNDTGVTVTADVEPSIWNSLSGWTGNKQAVGFGIVLGILLLGILCYFMVTRLIDE